MHVANVLGNTDELIELYTYDKEFWIVDGY